MRELVADDGLRASLVRGGLGTGGVQALSRAVTLVLGIILARGMGPEGYGVYAYVVAVMALLLIAAEAGVPALLMREIAAASACRQWGLMRGAMRRAPQLVAIAASGIAVAGMLLLWLVSGSIDAQTTYTAVLMLVLLPLAALVKTSGHAIRGLQRVVLGQAIELVRPLLVLFLVGLGFLLWPEFRQPQYAMAAQVTAGALVLLLAFTMLRYLTPAEAQEARPSYRNRAWFRSALPFALLGGAGFLNKQTDLIMLGWLRGVEEVGVYRVAVHGAMLVAFGLQAANMVVAPHFARLFARGEHARLQRLLTQSARVILAVALPVALTLLIAGDVIIIRVFGVAYADAYAPLAILCIGQVFNAAFGSVGNLLNMTGGERVSARVLWQTAFLNVVLNALLIPWQGMTGAATATAITLLAWNLLLYREVRVRLGLYPSAFHPGKS